MAVVIAITDWFEIHMHKCLSFLRTLTSGLVCAGNVGANAARAEASRCIQQSTAHAATVERWFKLGGEFIHSIPASWGLIRLKVCTK